MTNEQTIDEIMAAVITSQVATAAYDGSSGPGTDELERAMFSADGEVRDLITAALAAKDAEIERLEAQLADSDKQEPAAWRIRQGARVYIISNAEFVRSSFDAASMTPLYDKPQPAAEPAKPEPVEWIEWKGGECPIADDARIDVTCRDGDVLRDCLPSNLYWSHHADGNYWGDIVAYRVMA